MDKLTYIRSHPRRCHLEPPPNDDQTTLVDDSPTFFNLPWPPISTAAQIRLDAYLKLPATIPNETNTYNYPVLVTCEKKYYPVFPGSVPMKNKQYSHLISIAKFQQPILATALWGKRPLLEMYEAMKVIFEMGYRCDLYDTVPSIDGFHEEITAETTLNDVCAKYFEKVVGGVKKGPLVLGFKPREEDEDEDEDEEDEMEV